MAPRKGEGVYDAVVIGAGTAGLVTAAGTAGLGGRVALVERARMGGDCLNTGCVPSKALISSARLVHHIENAQRWGLDEQAPRFRFERIMERVRERRAAIAPHDSQERFESLGVDVFRGSARFRSPREVDVEGTTLRARHFVIATGSRAAIPPVEGLAEAHPFTNETIFDELEARPARMIVLGGGPIGCELGQAFARLGVEVTIVQRSRLLEKEDPDVTERIQRCLEEDGVRVLTQATARRVARSGTVSTVRVEVAGRVEDLEAEALLVAAGRIPNIEGLGLEAAGVAHDERGVTVDAHLRTTQPHIWAAGDVVSGGYQFTHVADHHARTIVRNMLLPWPKAKAETAVLPWCTFTSPEVGRVGMNEEQARGSGTPYDVWTLPVADLDRAVVESEEAGFAKVLTAKGGDRILGATIVSERGGDLVHEIVLAMHAGVGLKRISHAVHAYPTFAELVRRIADVQQRARLSPRALALFRRLWRWQRGSGG